MELDHVFVMCDVGAPEAAALHALGLREGSPNTHPGQGTACRRFFFGNAYLELVWVTDAAEAQAPARRADTPLGSLVATAARRITIRHRPARRPQRVRCRADVADLGVPAVVAR